MAIVRLGFRVGSWVRLKAETCAFYNLDPVERFRIKVAPRTQRGHLASHLRTDAYAVENRVGEPITENGNLIFFRASDLIRVYTVKNSGKKKKQQQQAA